MINKIIKEIIEKNITKIDLNDFEELYDSLEWVDDPHLGRAKITQSLTEALLDAGIDPLLYLQDVPILYLSGSDRYRKLELPSNIKSICSYAFSMNINLGLLKIPSKCNAISYNAFAHCPLQTIIIENPNILINKLAFYGCTEITKIIFHGTQDQWRKCAADISCFEAPGVIIHCTDGNIEF